jgi:drug/metabolite transporter (DMT)-like permease
MRGIALVLCSSVFMTSGDIASKYLAVTLPPIQITWLRYATFAAIMLTAVCFTGGLRRMRTRRPGLQVLRAIGVTVSSVLFIAGLHDLPMADATATSFVSPLFVTALSIPLLGEIVGWRRWLATVVGLIGVLIVVRPGGEGFHGASLFVLGSSLFWAFSLIVTRMMSRTETPVVTLAYSATLGFLMLSLMVPFNWQPLDLTSILIGAFIGGISTIGHILLITAFRHADASLLAPFAYAQLIWASIFGYLIFAAIPDLWTYVGAAIIVASGLYTAHRERIKARQLAGVAKPHR